MSEIDKLESYLKGKGAEYERIVTSTIFGVTGEQIVVYKNGRRKWDAVCRFGTYGFESGLLEIMGKPVVKASDREPVVGWLTAQDVINRLEEQNP